MSHPRLEELLAMRADEASQTTRAHVAACARCAGELERLYQVQSRLRALPALKPPRDRWPQLREQLVRERRLARRRTAIRSLVAAAAALLLVVLSWSVVELRRDAHQRALFASYLTDVQEQSLLLDAELRAVAAAPRAVTGARAAAIAELEDRLVELDGRLTAVTDRNEELWLWSRRLELQSALIGLRVAPERDERVSSL